MNSSFSLSRIHKQASDMANKNYNEGIKSAQTHVAKLNKESQKHLEASKQFAKKGYSKAKYSSPTNFMMTKSAERVVKTGMNTSQPHIKKMSNSMSSMSNSMSNSMSSMSNRFTPNFSAKNTSLAMNRSSRGVSSSEALYNPKAVSM